MTRTAAAIPARSRAVRVAITVALGAVVASGAAYVVWYLGLDPLWAATSVLAVGSVGAVLVTLGYEDDPAPWEASGRETPRGSRITVAIIQTSLAACERLARPTAIRRMRAFLIPERDDLLARATVMRRMRALLVGALHDRGLNPADDSHQRAIVALLGPDAMSILQPNDRAPVTSATIARSLDIVERLATETQGSR